MHGAIMKQNNTRMKLRQFLTAFTLVWFAVFAFAQPNAQPSTPLTQTIRGTIVDQESQFPLIGVNITVSSVSSVPLGASTDVDGSFRINGVPIGRQDLLVTYLGYKDVVLNDIIVSSAKEIILDIEMEETFTELEEVTIVARRNGEVLNEMATVSAREFSVQETNRYAGSRGEPARMAANFAGVQGADDTRNDIVIRGNTPAGISTSGTFSLVHTWAMGLNSKGGASLSTATPSRPFNTSTVAYTKPLQLLHCRYCFGLPEPPVISIDLNSP